MGIEAVLQVDEGNRTNTAEHDSSRYRAVQIQAIKGLKIGKIGFIATAGYEEKPSEYDFVDISALYADEN